MKRTRSVFGAIIASICLCFCFLFSGCGSKIEGTYKFQSMTYQEGGVSVELKVGEEFMGMMTLSEDFMVVTLSEDGVATAELSAGESTSTGTWEKTENGKLEITFEGDAQICECDGKTLTINIEGSQVVLAK